MVLLYFVKVLFSKPSTQLSLPVFVSTGVVAKPHMEYRVFPPSHEQWHLGRRLLAGSLISGLMCRLPPL